MNLSARPAVNGDVIRLVSLYREMEQEQTLRKPIWALTDGLDERFDMSLFRAIEEPHSILHVGTIDGAIVGFVWATIEPMLDRAQGSHIGRIRLIFTEPDARGVGVGHTMLTEMTRILRIRGVCHFDAPVGPGQRAAKNFFESHGFAARSIIMHSADGPDRDDE
ncbi:MAG: hypothetical protein BMS9Abin20_0071 [Acidimicrobiia bacterium]|nr:MAG: hypothetical protein BMS9Abin20_0071 [Acidimicrobiia bacterium]